LSWWYRLSYEGRLTGVLIALFLLPLSGTLGYMLIEGWDWFDAFYMTVITITTIGYKEVHPLSPAGRIFTVVFVFFGVGTALYALNVLAQTLLQTQRFLQRVTLRKVMRLANHYIICGGGRTGTRIASELQRLGKPYVLIERQEAAVRQLRQQGFLAIEGDATQEEVLKVANIEKAAGLVTVLPHDADNVFVVLTAKGLNPQLHIVARAEYASAEARLKRAGADMVVSPYEIGAVRLAYLLLQKSLIDTFELVTKQIVMDVHVQEVQITADHPFVGKTLRALDLTNRYRVIVLAMKLPDERIEFPPDPNVELQQGATLIIAGTEPQIRRLEQECEQQVELS